MHDNSTQQKSWAVCEKGDRQQTHSQSNQTTQANPQLQHQKNRFPSWPTKNKHTVNQTKTRTRHIITARESKTSTPKNIHCSKQPRLLLIQTAIKWALNVTQTNTSHINYSAQAHKTKLKCLSQRPNTNTQSIKPKRTGKQAITTKQNSFCIERSDNNSKNTNKTKHIQHKHTSVTAAAMLACLAAALLAHGDIM